MLEQWKKEVLLNIRIQQERAICLFLYGSTQ